MLHDLTMFVRQARCDEVRCIVHPSMPQTWLVLYVTRRCSTSRVATCRTAVQHVVSVPMQLGNRVALAPPRRHRAAPHAPRARRSGRSWRYGPWAQLHMRWSFACARDCARAAAIVCVCAHYAMVLKFFVCARACVCVLAAFPSASAFCARACACGCVGVWVLVRVSVSGCNGAVRALSWHGGDRRYL
jgi:hypothetical protein